jgi:hypothetical protein
MFPRGVREMPGEVKQLTADELAKLEVFPLPATGTVTLVQNGAHQYLLDCSNVSGADLKRLEDFWERMKGGLYAFRYESKTHRFPHCHFSQDTAHFLQHAPNRCSAQFALEVLPPYTT